MNSLDFFANSPPPKEGTKNFQSYIGELLEQQIIGDSELIRFIENLERGRTDQSHFSGGGANEHALTGSAKRAPKVFGQIFTRSKRTVGLVQSHSCKKSPVFE